MAIEGSESRSELNLEEPVYESVERFAEGEDPAYDDLETVFDELGLSTVSHFYGLAQREEQFQDMYQAYRKAHMYFNGSFREGNGRKERALEELNREINNYFGKIPTGETTETTLNEVAALTQFDPSLLTSSPVSEAEMRRLLEETR